jgi:hypothetical protein
VQVDPRLWANRYDLTVAVGLGSGSKEQFLRGSAVLGQLMKDISAAGMFGRVVTEQNVYNFARYTAEAIAPKKADLFFTDPMKLGPQEPKEDPKITLGKEKVAAMREKAQMQDAAQRDLKEVDFLTNVANLAKAPPNGEDKGPQFGHELEMQRMKMEHEAGMAREGRQSQNEFGQATQQVMKAGEQMMQMMQQLVAAQGELSSAIQNMSQVMAAEKEVLYDEAGEVMGVRPKLPDQAAAQ